MQVAAICQTSITDNQNLLSVIRFQDRIQIFGLTDEMKPQALQHLQLVLVLKSGEMRGKANLSIDSTAPSGKSAHHADAQVLFEGDERGAAAALPLPVVVEEEGLHYLDIKLDGTLITRIPFRVLYQKIAMPLGMPFPPNIG